MSLKFIDGFDQYQGQAGAQLLTSLTSAGYSVSSGLAIDTSRKTGGYALELQVTSGTAGDSWSSRTNNVKKDLHAADVDTSGRVVAVGDQGVAVYSDDNINWLPVILGVSTNMKSIRNHSTTWIAVGDGGTILRSQDGRSYSPCVSPVPAANLRDVAWGNGTWVAVGANGAVGVVFTSTDDGLTWAQISVASLNPANCVAFGDDWIMGCTGGQVSTSPDGNAWTNRSVGATTSVADIAFGTGGHWLAAVGSDIHRSIDGGTTWSLVVAGIMTGEITSLAEADGRWLACGTGAQLLISDDEETWTTAALSGISTTALYCVAVARGSRAGYIVVGALNQAQATDVRRATIYVSLAPPTRVTRTFQTAASKFTIGFAHHSTARGRVLSIDKVLDMDWSAGISILGESGDAIPARNIWYYYELTLDKTNLTATLHINNVLDLTAPLPGSIASKTSFDITWIAENGAVTRLDDLYIVDTDAPNGELLLDRLGPIQIPLRMPDHDVLTEWSTASGSSHWSQIGLLPPSNESFIRSATSGKQDLFTSSTALPSDAGTAAAPIIAVGVIALAQKGDIDNRQLGLVVGQGVTQKQVVDTALSVVPEYSVAIFEKAPGDVAWDADKILTTPFGVVVRP